MAGETDDEDELRHRQGAALYPLGRALRSTFDADNHATLSKDVTGLMLDLARVPFEPHEFEPLIPPPRPAPRPGWRMRLRLLLRRGR
jgi:hypothetical protein